MPQNSTGGVGILNVTLTDNSSIKFGVKIREVLFHKNAIFQGYTENTSAFSQFFAAVTYLDWDTFTYLYALNASPFISWTGAQIQEMALIPNATVTYELDDLHGELDFEFLGAWYGAPNISLYWKMLDLSEYQIPPGTYNLTFTASKPGYGTLQSIIPIEISKKNATITVISVEEEVAVEDNFLLVLELDETMGYSYLMTPVILNLTFTNNDTGEVAAELQWFEPVIQSITLDITIDNDTIPGNYILNVTIDSEYYIGSTEYNLNITHKELEISVDHDISISAGLNTNFSWSLENNNFLGNRENMSMQIFIDGQLFNEFNLTSNSTGWAIFNLGAGLHNVTYLIVSPFYSAVETIIINVQSPIIADDDDDDDDDKGEDNLLLIMVISIILIAVSALAIFMMISRNKVKAQRELESELIALKTKLLATENNVSHFETQMSEIAGIYWILIIHSEQGTAMVEITEFRFEEVLGESFEGLKDKGIVRDSALIGGFLTAIRNFSRETSGTSHEYQPVFNSETDYSTIVNDEEVHRRILEGTDYFMAFISSSGTMEISEILSTVNSKFRDGYGDEAKAFLGRISVFKPYKEEVVAYLHDEIRDLQKRLMDERLLLNQYQGHLRQVQEKIGIKKIK